MNQHFNDQFEEQVNEKKTVFAKHKAHNGVLCLPKVLPAL